MPLSAVKYHTGKFPPAKLNWDRLLPLIGPAQAAVAEYKGVLHGIPNVQVLLAPLISQEAVLSSKIEGTQATLGEVLEFEAAEETATGEKRNDIQEILNYRRALRLAVDALRKLPLSQRVMRDTHQELMQGVRGENKTPGEYRRIPNWIGPAGCTIETAHFVPPNADQVPVLMTEWEKYLHQKPKDSLVQLAILHAEFEAIHPFLDGNGRIGRLFVPLFLVDKGMLGSPDFYVSDYLEAQREEYYNRLLAVSRENDWTGWCTFFLKALTEQAQDNKAKAQAILQLYQSKKDWITEQTHSQYAIRALDWFFNRPIFKVSDFVASATIPKPTANRIVRIARNRGLLSELRPGSGRRAAILAFPELLNIAEGRSVF
ncbi:MAG: Fic family protein [Sedimentisphaerales bacterium]|nr:Fic family protein [Sedimentisphaerales bacterium]